LTGHFYWQLGRKSEKIWELGRNEVISTRKGGNIKGEVHFAVRRAKDHVETSLHQFGSPTHAASHPARGGLL
jgi:hypothetical protein